MKNSLQSSGDVIVTGTIGGNNSETVDMYTDSVAQGTILGNYKVGEDLGSALSLNSTNWGNLDTSIWSNDGDQVLNPSGTYTIMTYAKITSRASESQAILFGTGNGNGNGFALEIGHDNNAGKIGVLRKGKAHDTTATPTGFDATEWNHYALVISGGTVEIMINGESYTTMNLGTDFTAANSGAALGGGSYSTGQGLWTGAMDEFKIFYGAALSAEEIRSAAGLVVVPEPSAFGLLAGLGALALAGTRRRRRK